MINQSIRKIKKRAFTLVELLIVVIIIGILSASLIPKGLNYFAKARDTKRIMDLHTIATAVEAYQNSHGYFPRKNADYTQTIKEKYNISVMPTRRNHIGSANQISSDLLEYLSEVPRDPQTKPTTQNLHRGCNHIYRSAHTDDPFCKRMNIGNNITWWEISERGEYFYISILSEKGKRRFFLFAHVERPESANFVMGAVLGIGFATDSPHWLDPTNPHYKAWNGPWTALNSRCSTVQKTTRPIQIAYPAKDTKPANSNCYYNHPSQLFYVISID